MKRFAVLAVVAALGCNEHGKGGAAPDGLGDDIATPGCHELDVQIADALALHGTCTSDADCTVIGGQLDFPTCDCAPFVIDCAGRPFEKNAPGLESAKALAQQFVDAGCATAQFCDCAPIGDVHCDLTSRRCTGEQQSCFPNFPDAGVGADAQ